MSKIGRFMKVCKLNKGELKGYLTNWIRNYYSDVVVGDGFVYARGNMNVLLTAHMDTVHDESLKKYITVSKKKEDGRVLHTLTSKQGIGGDDRCGVYMIMKIVERGYRPFILFCEDEEIGGVGSKKFVETNYITELEKMLFLVELDRAHDKDLVYYDDDNKEFHSFCEEVTGYKESYGSFSDISVLSPYCMVSSVNISCGYYNAHHLDEYVVFEEMEDSIEATIKLLDASKNLEKGFEYEEHIYTRGYGYYGYGYGYNSNLYQAYKNEKSELYYEYDGDNCEDWYQKIEDKANEEPEKVKAWIFMLEDGSEVEALGRSLQEAIGQLMIENCELSWSMVMDYYMY